MARVCAAPPLLVREVGLGGEGVDPATNHVRRHRVIHEQVGHSGAVTVVGDMHVYLIAQDLGGEKI